MADSPAGPLGSWRRLPAERRIVVTAAGVLAFLLFVAVGCSGEDPAKPDAAGSTSAPAATTSPTTTTASTTTTTTPAVRVADVVDGRTITVAGAGQVRLAGLAQPGECWAATAVDFLKKALVGKDLRVVGGTVLLPDGVDVAVHLLNQGMARADQGAAAALTTAQAVAEQAGRGLWGAPCAGADTVAPPPPVYTPPAPQPVQPAPQPQPQPQPEPERPASAYYANCDAVRAAGKAPLYAGQPGYRPGLDRDGDGTACEK